MSSMNEPKLSVHQLIQILGSDDSNRGSVASSSSSSAIRANNAAAMQTPKSSAKRGVPARRILFSSSPAPNASGNNHVNSAPPATNGKPSTKRSSSVLASAQPALGATPKSSTAAARSTFTNGRALIDQLQNGNLPVSHSGSPISSPAVQGKKVTVSELFGASTSATVTPKSTKTTTPFFKVKHDSESSANIEVSTILSPNMTGSPMANAFVTPTSTHNRQHLRRQQSASATLVSGRYGGNAFLRASTSACSVSRRFTPPPGKEISSPIFAASKYVESPSASSLPLPPSDWIQDAIKAKHASIAEDLLEDDESTLRPLFFLNTAAAVDEDESDDTGKSSMTDDASSTASSGAIFDMEDVHVEKTALPTSTATDSMDSGEGSLSSASDNECDSIATPSTPTSGKLAGVRMNPFSLIAAVASPQV